MGKEYSIVKWTQADPPEADTLHKSMISEGYDVFKWSDGPHTVYDMHSHQDDQSHWIISGRFGLTIKGVGKFTLEPGDRDFMPAGTRHSARVNGGKAVYYLIGAKR